MTEIVGRGDVGTRPPYAYYGQTLARAQELGVEPILLGPVDHDRLRTLMAAAEVFAFPSIKEGFGLAAMESLAAGTPVVMRDLPVLREVFADTVAYTSDYVSLAGAIASSTRDPDVIARGRALTHAARSQVNFFVQLH